MLIVGLVGGIASGKSTVAAEFRRLGATVLDADQTGHEVLREPAVIAALRNRWGERVLDASGQISRSAVAKIVFALGHEADKLFLEQLTHPRIQMRLQQQVQQLQAGPRPPPIAVLDAALLFEAGWDKICDQVVFVDAPRDVRLARARARGWTDEQFAAREASQMPADEKRKRSSLSLDNSAVPASTNAQIEQILRQLLVPKG